MANKQTDNAGLIKPIAIPGIHDKFYKHLKSLLKEYNKPALLDIGAGHGYLTKKLYDEGYDIHACDLFPEHFYFEKVNCKKVDLTHPLPYDDKSFDIVIAVEVMEHISVHEHFFSEAYRILKNGGTLIFSTPNILSLKSRFRFLFSGFFYSFNPLDYNRHDGLQHTASLTIDQYKYLAIKNQFTDIKVSYDKKQNSSLWLSVFIPFIWLYCKVKKISYPVHNKHSFLWGRVLFVNLRK